VALWDWAVDVYRRPQVAEAALALQDEHGQNTCFLLWSVWARGPEPKTMVRAAELARSWEDQVLAPLRQARRNLKLEVNGVEAGARLALREDVKGAELRAERVLLEALEALTGRNAGDEAPVVALRRAAVAWGAVVPGAALGRLAEALG
jgi:uncharacterized protein (TIGR02444 family)